MSFLYQNCSTSAEFSFSGSEQNGAATVHPDNGNGPISVTYGPYSFQLGGCMQYLQWARFNADCQFTLSPQGPQGG